jgi:hypothetical protein
MALSAEAQNRSTRGHDLSATPPVVLPLPVAIFIERTRDARAAEKITDQDLLREVMNTVGKKERLGEQIRCVVSVSTLTEGWDSLFDVEYADILGVGVELMPIDGKLRSFDDINLSPISQGNGNSYHRGLSPEPNSPLGSLASLESIRNTGAQGRN